MVNCVDGLLMSRSPSIGRVSKIAPGGIRDWLPKLDFTPSENGNQLVLSVNNWELYLSHIAADLSRLLIAGSETLSCIQIIENRPKSTSWSLIKAYYASFYYAHSILRFCRLAPSYFKTSELQKLSHICHAYGVTSVLPLKTNQYMVHTDDTNRRVVLEKITGSDGSHETTWKEISQLAMSSKALVATSSYTESERNVISNALNDFLKALSGASSAGIWLSSFRNDIQYSQKMGVWYPYKNGVEADYVVRRTRFSMSDNDPSDYDISDNIDSKRFLECCLFICHVGRKFAKQATQSEQKSFMNIAYNKFENIVNQTHV